jgi:hypothetical protein
MFGNFEKKDKTLFYLDKFLSFQNSKKLHMVENQI